MITPGTRLAMAASAKELRPLVTDVAAVLDRAHAYDLSIPPRVREAVETLSALVLAWGHNAQGLPAPAPVRAALGLADLGGGDTHD